MDEEEYEKRFGNKTGRWIMKCSACGFGCRMEFDSGDRVVPTRLNEKKCLFEELFWPDQKPVWEITVEETQGV
jgi:hypothetical protein